MTSILYMNETGKEDAHANFIAAASTATNALTTTIATTNAAGSIRSFASRPLTASSSTVGASSLHSSSLLSESVKVIVRCRPLSATEITQGHRSIVSMNAERGIVEVSNPKEPQQPLKCFTFDAIYDETSKQIELYDETFRDLVDSVLCGFNGTIFAYGQTGTGKTFTMEGVRENAELRGVIPNTIEHIFCHIAHAGAHQQFLVRASYLEIYQEEIRDLLDSKNANRRLELKERSDIGVFVKDLSSFVTKSVEEIEQVLAVGHANRSVGCTNMNEHSSRSHAIFILTIECSERGADGENHIRVGRLNLVDLAGSERQSKTGTQGQRFREMTKINLSLSALGNVISALVDNSGHIPYRDSKLTRLLQGSLGGNSKTVMIANVGPASYNYEETMSTLRYASRAKKIQNKPRINEDPKDALLRQFQDEINRLKALLEKRINSANGQRRHLRRRQHQSDGAANINSLADENNRDECLEDMSAEEEVYEQQLRLEMEREELLKSTSIVDEEKRRMLASLEVRAAELTREREMQTVVAAKIRAMQSKLLSGDGSFLDQTVHQQELLQKRRFELAEQKNREREIAQRLEAQEDSTAEIRETFANLRQEVEAKTRKLQKFLTKFEQVRLEIHDSTEVNARERDELAAHLTDIDKELKLRCLLIENFVPLEFVEYFRENAAFDADEGVWLINGEAITNERSFARKRPNTAASPRSLISVGDQSIKSQSDVIRDVSTGEAMAVSSKPLRKPEMVDSGLESSGGSGNGQTTASFLILGGDLNTTNSQTATSTLADNDIYAFNDEATSSQAQHLKTSSTFLLKRPVSMAGLRRPMCNFERNLLIRLRQRMQRATPQPLQLMITTQRNKEELLPGDFINEPENHNANFETSIIMGNFANDTERKYSLPPSTSSTSSVSLASRHASSASYNSPKTVVHSATFCPLPSPPKSIVPAEVARVCYENLLTYESLIHFPSTSRSAPTADDAIRQHNETLNSSTSNLVIDASKIPMPRTLTRRSSQTLTGRMRRTSSAAPPSLTMESSPLNSSTLNTSKNLRARSVLGGSVMMTSPQNHPPYTRPFLTQTSPIIPLTQRNNRPMTTTVGFLKDVDPTATLESDSFLINNKTSREQHGTAKKAHIGNTTAYSMKPLVSQHILVNGVSNISERPRHFPRPPLITASPNDVNNANFAPFLVRQNGETVKTNGMENWSSQRRSPQLATMMSGGAKYPKARGLVTKASAQNNGVHAGTPASAQRILEVGDYGAGANISAKPTFKKSTSNRNFLNR